ncbi:catechol 1,2-dioxygenase [Micromonospora endophytica]|uniref:Catechol 1,2-dioxygenase n=1 Tax=Micromonospora endophytica TaxID=515350 RepID=A0A2W2BZF7_9ACTN|nr:catechol 1,2-dioxygenase [Micromonospora endophytica]PZF92641.1 catechol 1,2-dioxygenase [Micromonospora endophytica]RIW49833.1 catechol 1,2-dioxygenase [Micromonospora endophytica]BCJ57236.1 2,3-dihydroxyphenylpropionate 1,2-dioxygenase [Micromonospora endophytica]
MSTVVAGVAASHSTLMNTHWAEVDHLAAAHRFRDGLAQARAFVAAQRPDAIVVIGSNHFRGLFLDLMPAVTIGVAEVQGAGEAGTPEGPLPVDRELAKTLVDGLIDDGFDPAFSLRLTVDHGITHSLQHLVPGLDVPIVPVVVNMFAPPLISLPRAYALGASIGRAVAADSTDKRVLVLASGGLSHRLPWPDWSRTLSDDDRFLVEAWLNGRQQWREYEVRRRQIIRAAQPDINADFDREFLAQFESGDLSRTLALSNDELEKVAGNGAQELRSWIAMTAAVGAGRGRTLAYEPIDEWLTGMGVAVFEPIPTSTDQHVEGRRR